MKKSLKPSLPNYIPLAEGPMAEWLANYKVQLPLLGPAYGISEQAIAAALEAINALLASLGMLAGIRQWLSKWVECNELLQYDKPKDPSVLVKWPAPPQWAALPDPVAVNAWQPILDTTRDMTGKRVLSAQDKQALKLYPYEPAQRRQNSVQQYEYPLLRLSEEGGSILVRTTRGKKYKGLMAKYVIDYSNNGLFEDLTASVDKDVWVPVRFPDGVSMMTWTIRAVYIANGEEASLWCPPVSIVLHKEGPLMVTAPTQQGIDPLALERSLKNILEGYKAQPEAAQV